MIEDIKTHLVSFVVVSALAFALVVLVRWHAGTDIADQFARGDEVNTGKLALLMVASLAAGVFGPLVRGWE